MPVLRIDSGVFNVSGTLVVGDIPSGPLGCPARVAAYIADVISDSPSVYYRFNDASGVTAADSSGNGLDGTYVGATQTFQQNPGPTTCTTDEYVSQNGSNSSVDLTASALDVIGSPGQDFTFETWIQTSGFGYALVEKTTAGGGENWNSLAIVNSISGRVRVQMLAGANPFVDGATAINDGAWHHCVGVFDRGAGEIRVYVDGALDASAVAIPSNGSFDSSFTDKMEFGDRDRGSGAGSLAGDMAHGAVYLSALSADRILSHYNAAVSGT